MASFLAYASKNTNMRTLMTLGLMVLLGMGVQAQVWKNPEKLIKKKTGGVGFSQEEAAQAIKEALGKGVIKGVNVVSKADGYLGNPEIKIPFPPEAQAMEKKLRSIGMGNKVDEFVTSMNRAAENAATEAKPIFVGAIKQMTVKDAITIVQEDGHPATDYLNENTSTALAGKFQPKIQQSLDEVDATRLWKDLVTTYNKIPLVKKMEPDLAKYVTEKAIDGLFVMVAKEEENIRDNPAARTTDMLKKVFGQ